MARAVAYVRVSTNKQLNNTSIEKQKEEIKKYCKKNNITLVHIYDEGAKSAKGFKNRPQFKQMYSHVFDTKENIDYVIVHSADRLSRDNMESLYILRRITDSKKHLICLADNIDTKDPKAKLLYQFMAIVAELEKDMIKLRTYSGMERNAEEGKFNGGSVYGYSYEDKKLKIAPSEAKIVQYIFEKYAHDRWGYRKIATNLNDQGLKTRKGKFWSITAIKTILNNRIYIGELKWKKSYTKSDHIPIIDTELWKETQKMLELNSFTPKKIHPGSFPLSGLLKCPKCNSPMVQANSSSKYKYYQCSKRKNSGKSACHSDVIRKESTEQYVYEHLFETLKKYKLHTPVISTTLSSLSNEVQPLEEQLKSMNKELADIAIKKSEIIDWKREGILNDLTFKQQMSGIQDQEKELEQFIANVKGQIQQRNKQDMDQFITSVIDNFSSFFHLLSDQDKKKLLHSFIDEIHVVEAVKIQDRTVEEIVFKYDLDHLLDVS